MNGRHGVEVGSPTVAAATNNLVALTVLLVVGLAAGTPRRVRRRWRLGARPRAWHLAVLANSALGVYITAKVAPEIGVALLTVGLVLGQTSGSLGVDAAGLTPARRQAVTPARVAGAALAVAAVVVGATTSSGDLHIGLLALVAVAGAGIALQQAGLGHVAESLGDPIAASIVNMTIGGAILGLAAVLATGSLADVLPAAPDQWIGGILGAGVATTLAATVGTLGAVRLTLAIVAGQSLGALVVDWVAPAAGHQAGIGTIVSLVLAFAAVAIGARAGRTVVLARR